jgi:NTP pyrophosphatase (non-canonical NTP hydrolase)
VDANERDNMKFIEYQNEAKKTAVYPGRGTVRGQVYTVMGLAGEVGELANKVKKLMREDTTTSSEDVLDECGDILWYVAMIIDELGIEQIDSIDLTNIEQSKIEHGNIPMDVQFGEWLTFRLVGETADFVDTFMQCLEFPDWEFGRDLYPANVWLIARFLAKIASVHGSNLSTVAESNIRKLASRQERNAIKGNGDHR